MHVATNLAEPSCEWFSPSWTLYLITFNLAEHSTKYLPLLDDF